MAFIITTTNKKLIIPAAQANTMWLVKTGEIQGTPAQKAFVKTIRNIYLNTKNPSTPKSYLDKKLALRQVNELFPAASNRY